MFLHKTQLNISIFLIILSIFFFIFSFVKPSIFKLPNFIWSKFGIVLGKLISPIVLFIIFFLLITPIGLLMRLIGKDLLNEKISNNIKSYWIKRKNQMNNMKAQF